MRITIIEKAKLKTDIWVSFMLKSRNVLAACEFISNLKKQTFDDKGRKQCSLLGL